MTDRKDLAERLLESQVNDLIDELGKIRPGDPEHIRVSARLILARKELEDYRDWKRK